MPGQESGDDNSRAKSFSNFCLMVDKPPGGTFARLDQLFSRSSKETAPLKSVVLKRTYQNDVGLKYIRPELHTYAA